MINHIKMCTDRLSKNTDQLKSLNQFVLFTNYFVHMAKNGVNIKVLGLNMVSQ